MIVLEKQTCLYQKPVAASQSARYQSISYAIVKTYEIVSCLLRLVPCNAVSIAGKYENLHFPKIYLDIQTGFYFHLQNSSHPGHKHRSFK